eukprot:1169804-Amorphochlora_amoeboformis.AAC.1
MHMQNAASMYAHTAMHTPAYLKLLWAQANPHKCLTPSPWDHSPSGHMGGRPLQHGGIDTRGIYILSRLYGNGWVYPAS